MSRNHSEVYERCDLFIRMRSLRFARAAVSSVLLGEQRGRKAAALVSPFPSLCVHPALSGNDIKSLKRLQAAFKVGARPNSSGSVAQDANFSQVLIKKNLKKDENL